MEFLLVRQFSLILKSFHFDSGAKFCCILPTEYTYPFISNSFWKVMSPKYSFQLETKQGPWQIYSSIQLKGCYVFNFGIFIIAYVMVVQKQTFKNREECPLPELPPFYQAYEEQDLKERNLKWKRSKLHVLRSKNMELVLPEQLLE